MRLRQLTAVTFRNYPRLDFTPHPQCTILCGRNGQGKTNVLEAVALLATARSHRSARDQDLRQWGAEGYRVDGTFEDKEQTLRTVLVYDGVAKRAECDGVAQPKLSAILGRTPVSMFGPEDLDLVKGGPSQRRRFLDLNLTQLSAAYLANLQTYTRALRQRNKALKNQQRGAAGADAVAVWDEPLVEAGSRVHVARREYIAALSVEAAAVYTTVSEAQEELDVVYQPNVAGGETEDAVAQAFREQLARTEDSERAQGTTVCGPHRDDMLLRLNGRALREFGSQGQHRSAVLALKLAEGAVMRLRCATLPITLLDDFASELDEGRQAGILERVAGDGQVIITTTELTAPLRAVADKLVLYVAGATLQEHTG